MVAKKQFTAEIHDLDRFSHEKQAAIKYWRFKLNGVEADIASSATLAEAHELLGCNSVDVLEPMLEMNESDPELSDDEVTWLLDQAVDGLSRNRAQMSAQ